MDEYAEFSDATQPDTEWQIRTGVVRFGSAGPYILSNSSHVTVGIPSVEIATTGALWIHSDGANLGSIVVNGDEQTARLGILLGVSSGVGVAKVSFYRIDFAASLIRYLNLTVPADYAQMTAGTLGAHNVWVTWMSPLVRGVGAPSKADRALERLAALEARVDALEV